MVVHIGCSRRKGMGGKDRGIQKEKAALRERMKRLREELSWREVRERSERVVECLRGEEVFGRARCIHCYVSFRNEVSTLELMEDALRRGVEVVVPVVEAPPQDEQTGLREAFRERTGLDLAWEEIRV